MSETLGIWLSFFKTSVMCKQNQHKKLTKDKPNARITLAANK
jgi:hypothetical protein